MDPPAACFMPLEEVDRVVGYGRRGVCRRVGRPAVERDSSPVEVVADLPAQESPKCWHARILHVPDIADVAAKVPLAEDPHVVSGGASAGDVLEERRCRCRERVADGRYAGTVAVKAAKDRGTGWRAQRTCPHVVKDEALRRKILDGRRGHRTALADELGYRLDASAPTSSASISKILGRVPELPKPS